MLIEKGAKIDEKDNNGDQPVHAAAKSKNCNAVYVLQQSGAEMCATGIRNVIYVEFAWIPNFFCLYRII